MKVRIAAWTQIDWAFGRIAHDLQRHVGAEFEIELFDWRTFHPAAAFEPFDLIYIPVWDHILKFRAFYPEIPPQRLCFSVHCRAELFHYDIAQARLVAYDEETVERCELRPELLAFLQRQRLISVVSPEIEDLLQNRYGLNNLRSTIIGIDPDTFSPGPQAERSDGAPLIVVHTLPRRGMPLEMHGYDPKRSWILAEVEERLLAAGANVRFVFADERLPLSAMPDFYRMGDVHVCVSHSEGLPTVGLESIACGLAQISTPVGVMPSMVGDAGTGFLLRETKPTRIIEELCERICELEKDRETLREMKRNAIALRSHLMWEHRIGAWRDFFREAAEFAQRTPRRPLVTSA